MGEEFRPMVSTIKMNGDSPEKTVLLVPPFIKFALDDGKPLIPKVDSMPFSYFLHDESPEASGFLWATLATAFHQGAKLLLVEESDSGITLGFDQELSQTEIMSLLLGAIMPEVLNTPDDNISNVQVGQVGE